MQKLLAFVLFIGASFLVLRVLVSLHAFFADVPIEPLLGEDGVAVFLSVYFSIAILCGGLALTLSAINARRIVVIGLLNIAVLAIVAELYVLAAGAFDSALALMAGAFVANSVLVIVFFRNSLKAASRSSSEHDRTKD